MTLQNLGDIFTFIGGLGLFLYGMNTMADGLQRSASSKMKKLMGFLTNNRFLGVVFGAVITAIIQSSSATTVMVVGFVNAGILNLVQAVGVIMGANIGTTITAWIVSMSEWGSIFKPEFFAPLLVGVGVVLTMFVNKKKGKEVGEILVGIGVLFIGLTMMSGAIKSHSDAPIFTEAFRVLGSNPVLGILTGTIVTAIIQSSSASVGILQTLAMNGVVNWRSAIFITLGQNIGTCVTALLSSIGAQKNAKRAAVIHLLFNVFGAVIFGIAMYFIFLVNQKFAVSSIDSVQISIFHTIFNITNTLLLFPFAKLLVRLSERIVRDKKVDEDENDVASIERALDDRIFENPSFAVETASKEVVRMGLMTMKSVRKAMNALLENEKDDIEYVLDKEKDIDYLEKILTEYLVKVDNLSLSEEQHDQIKNLLYTIHDIERIGDHSENLVELAKKRMDDGIRFSEVGYRDMKEIAGIVMTSVESSIEARDKMDYNAVRTVSEAEDDVDNLEDDLRERHIKRLSENKCSMESGVIFLDALTNLERMSDHAYNIAGYVQSEL